MAETASGHRRRRLALLIYLVGSAGIGLGIGMWITMGDFVDSGDILLISVLN